MVSDLHGISYSHNILDRYTLDFSFQIWLLKSSYLKELDPNHKLVNSRRGCLSTQSQDNIC